MKTHLRFLMIAVLAMIGAIGNAWAQTDPTPSTVTTDLSASAKAHTVVPFSVNITKNDATATDVKLVFKLTGDNVATQATQLELKDSDATAIAVGANGEAVLGTYAFDATLSKAFTAKFNAIGTFAYTLELLNDDDGANKGVEIASVSKTTVVEFMEPTVNTTLDIVSEGVNKIRTKEDVLFRLYADPNDRTGDMVNIKLTLADPSQYNKFSLKYNTTGNEFETLTVGDNGVLLFGPEGGFEFSTAFDQLMKINFNATGSYTYKVEIVRVDGNILADVTETVNVLEGATVATTLGGTTIVKGKTVDFDLNVDAGSWPNTTKVFPKVILANPAQAANIQLFYEAAPGDYQPLAFNTEGVATYGDPVEGINLADGTLKLRAVASETGTYTYSVELIKKVDLQVATMTQETVTVKFDNATIASNLNNKAGVKTSVAQNVAVTAVANDNAGDMVLAKLTLGDAAQKEHMTVELQTGENTYEQLAIDANGVAYVGPTGGYPLADGVMPLRVTFAEAGTYTYTVALVTPGTTETVVASSSESVVVDAFQNATVATTLDKRSVEKDAATTFTVTATANDVNPATMVRGRLTLADASKAANIALEYLDTDATYKPIVFTNGVALIGPAEGMAMSDVNALGFRVTFNAASTYAYTLDLVNVNGGAVVATASESVEALTTTGIKKGFEKGGYAVYPTLTTGALKVDLLKARNASIQVVDMMGRAVVTKNNVNGIVELDLSKVAKGTYIVRIQDGSNVNTQRVIVR